VCRGSERQEGEREEVLVDDGCQLISLASLFVAAAPWPLIFFSSSSFPSLQQPNVDTYSNLRSAFADKLGMMMTMTIGGLHHRWLAVSEWREVGPLLFSPSPF
jgi:hypothetical protein